MDVLSPVFSPLPKVGEVKHSLKYEILGISASLLYFTLELQLRARSALECRGGICWKTVQKELCISVPQIAEAGPEGGLQNSCSEC